MRRAFAAFVCAIALAAAGAARGDDVAKPQPTTYDVAITGVG